MTMDWFRYHHGTPQDAKLTMIAKQIGVRRCEMTAIWDELMDYASRHVTRGHVGDIDLEVIAFTQEVNLEDVRKIYHALEEKKVISNGVLAAFEKRQPKREDDTATQRQRQKRARDKEKKEAAKKSGVTPPDTHDHEASRNVTTDKSRLDKIRGDKKEETPPISTDLKTPPNPPQAGNGVLKNGNLGWDVERHLDEKAIDAARKNAPEWDIYLLMRIYNEGVTTRGIPTHPKSAFPAWCLKYTKGKPPYSQDN